MVAWWRTVCLYLSWHSRVSGHLCWSIFTMLTDPYCTAMCVGISPSLLACLRFAPLSIRSCTMSSLLPSQARWSGVLPLRSDAWSISFKLRLITLATSLCPFRQAMCSGVLSFASWASDSWALWWISSSTTLHIKQNKLSQVIYYVSIRNHHTNLQWPCSAARCMGRLPSQFLAYTSEWNCKSTFTATRLPHPAAACSGVFLAKSVDCFSFKPHSWSPTRNCVYYVWMETKIKFHGSKIIRLVSPCVGRSKMPGEVYLR